MEKVNYQQYGTADSSIMDSPHCLQVYVDSHKSGYMYFVFTQKYNSGDWHEEVFIQHPRSERGLVYQSRMGRIQNFEGRDEWGEYPDFSKMEEIGEDEFLRMEGEYLEMVNNPKQ